MNTSGDHRCVLRQRHQYCRRSSHMNWSHLLMQIMCAFRKAQVRSFTYHSLSVTEWCFLYLIFCTGVPGYTEFMMNSSVCVKNRWAMAKLFLCWLGSNGKSKDIFRSRIVVCKGWNHFAPKLQRSAPFFTYSNLPEVPYNIALCYPRPAESCGWGKLSSLHGNHIL